MIWSVFPVTGAEHAAFLAFSGQQCGRAGWQLSRSLPHIVLNVTCIKAKRELGQPKVAALIYFPCWSYLCKNNTEEPYVSFHFMYISLHFFPSGAKGDRGGRFHFLISFCF